MIVKKTCTKCSETKLLAEFSQLSDSRRKSGGTRHSAQCRACARKSWNNSQRVARKKDKAQWAKDMERIQAREQREAEATERALERLRANTLEALGR